MRKLMCCNATRKLFDVSIDDHNDNDGDADDDDASDDDDDESDDDDNMLDVDI